MSHGSIREYAAALRPRYRAASKEEKGRLLDEFCAVTGYHRKAAVRLLSRAAPEGGRRRGRQRQYGREVAVALKEVWEAADRICSKRLTPYLPELVAVLERHGELDWGAGVRHQVLRLSAATMDRLLRPFRMPGGRRPYTQSAAATALKALVPVRTFGEWAGVAPGAFQGDLVAHCGETTAGFYLNPALRGWWMWPPVGVPSRWCGARARAAWPRASIGVANGSPWGCGSCTTITAGSS